MYVTPAKSNVGEAAGLVAVVGESVSRAGDEATRKLGEQERAPRRTMAALRGRGAPEDCVRPLREGAPGAREPGQPGSESDLAPAPARPRGLLAARRASGRAAAAGQTAGSRRPRTAAACRGDAYSPRSWPRRQHLPNAGGRERPQLLRKWRTRAREQTVGAGRGAGRASADAEPCEPP